MSGLKNRRGRPKRNNIKALQQHQINELHSTISPSDCTINIKQPLTVYRVVGNEPLLEERDNSAEQGVQLSRLPKVGFTERENIKMDENMDNEEQRSQELQLLQQHYGEKWNLPYERPENHYIHHKEPNEGELYETVEYDMDEQDKVWLELYNTERSKELLGDISPFLFESIMDKLEKEWFNLIKDAPKPSDSEVILPEDSACAVCDDTEVENSNAIVFCDGCNVAVHQDCYGIPYIPEGQWLCRKCMISPENPVSCLFCPNEGGAFKQTNTNQWGHLLCAIWIPEIGVSNTVYMEPIDMIENVPKSRWKLTCFICRKKQGACIQCDNKHCFSAFHVTCAKSAKLCMKMTTHSSEGVVLKAYCDKHTPKEHDRVLNVPPTRGRGRGRGRGSSSSGGSTRDQFNNNKVARAHQHHYTTGAPIAPDAILVKIDNLPCVRNSSIRKRAHVVTAIAHYWSLKRESRRGAPLLKRLHLEPWTASSKYTKGETDYYIRRSIITQLRADLDKVRMLSEQVRKRELQKLQRTKKQKSYIDMILYPLEYVLRPILDQFMEIDRKKVFLNHVTAEQAPDYSSVIEKSMCFSEIEQKLSLHQYTHLDQFKEDVQLIWENSMQYNKAGTGFYKVATKLKVASEKLFAIAEEKMSRYELNDGIWDVPVDESLFEYKLIEEEEEEEEEDEEEIDVEELSSDAVPEPETKKEVVVRQPKYRRTRKGYQANPRLLGSLRTRVSKKAEEENGEVEVVAVTEPTDTNAVTEANVQSLTIQTEQPTDPADTTAKSSSNEPKQTFITSFFAEQHRKEQQRKEERERKQLAEEQAQLEEKQDETEEELTEDQSKEQEKREKKNNYERERRARKKLEAQANKQKQASPPAEVICYDIETMQPISVLKPLTPPPAPTEIMTVDTSEEVESIQPPLSDTIPSSLEPAQPASTKEVSSQPTGNEMEPTITVAETSQPSEVEAESSSSANAESSKSMEPKIESTDVIFDIPTDKDSNDASSNNKKRKRPSGPIPRTTRSAGLKASIEELTKRPKISHEARTLFASYNGVSHLDKPTEVYKEDRKKSAPVGWVYLEDEDDNNEPSSPTNETSEPALTAAEIKAQKYARRKRNDIPVPNFKRGEIVWAQVTGYPSHPAKFLNLPDDQCSPSILKSRRYQGDILVEFLCVPEIHKWGWVRRGSICEVGDIEEDKRRLSESLAKKPKRNVFIQEAKEGYRYAGQILGLDPEPAIDAVFNNIVQPKKKKKPAKRY